MVERRYSMIPMHVLLLNNIGQSSEGLDKV